MGQITALCSIREQKAPNAGRGTQSKDAIVDVGIGVLPGMGDVLVRSGPSTSSSQ